MSQNIRHHTFPNGLTLLLERMEHVRSAALNFLVPVGCAHDPAGRSGLANLLADMITRGAGKRDSRNLLLAFDSLGLDRSESANQLTMRFWASTLASNLPPALELYADILQHPLLPADELDAVKALALQDLHGLEDEPQQKVMVELRRRHWPYPLGRDRRGTEESLAKISPTDIRKHWGQAFGAQGTILSVAGNVDWEPLKDQVEKLFGGWQTQDSRPMTLKKPLGGRAHLKKDTTQTQIALAYPAVPFGHPDFYTAQGAVQVLSGGMGARLFTEVREKRGLCYSVFASYQTFKDRACIFCYAGTTAERAQETLDVSLNELRRLQDGVTDEEVQRVQAGLKSAVIMQEESTSARAGALASDWYFLGRVRPRREIQQAIDALTPAAIVRYVRDHPPRDMTLVTLGPKPLKLNGEN